MSGTISDTYVAALQHGTTAVPDEAVKLGVVRRPTPWFYACIDENVPALAPPTELLDEVKDRYAALLDEGVDDTSAHNLSMDDVDFDERYLAQLEASREAMEAIEAVRERLRRGEDIVLVCYENTDEKRCHRTLLRAKIERADPP